MHAYVRYGSATMAPPHHPRADTMNTPPGWPRGTPPPSAAEAPDDEALLALVRDDDVLALHRLMQRHWGPVLSYAKAILGDADAAADVAQQVFIRIWRGRKRWRPTARASAYVFRIARNATRNELRASRTRDRHSLTASRLSAMPSTPLEHLEAHELEAAVEHALARLPARRRQVYELAHVRKLSHREIAAIMGITTQTVANHMYTAVQELRRYLEPLLEGGEGP